MIRYAVLAAIVAILLGAVMGLSSRVAPLPVAPVTAVRQAVPSIAPPVSDLRPAARYFGELNAPPPPPKPKAPPPPPKPVPPDIATLFRRDLGAILPGPRVVVADHVKGQRVSRILVAGDFYADGWRIAALSGRSATLRKGREQRLINFFGPSPSPPGGPAATGIIRH